MSISFQGIDDLVITFQAADGVKKGEFAVVTGNDIVGPCSYGAAPAGLALGVRSGCAAVQVRGYVEVGYTGTLATGWAELTAQAGKVRTASAGETGRRCLVVRTDATAKTAGLFLC